MPSDILPSAPAVAALRDATRRSPRPALVLGGTAGRILHANPAFCDAARQPEAALLDRPLQDAVPDLGALLGGPGFRPLRRLAAPRLHAEEPPRPWVLEASPLLDAEGRAETGCFLQLEPVWDAAATLDALFEHIPEGLILADAPDGCIRRVSAFGLGQAGREAEAVTGRAAEHHPADWEVLHLDGATPARPEELPLTRAIRRGETVQHESWMLRRRDGSLMTILCSAGPIRGGPEGGITGGIVVWRDVSAMRRTEENLARSEARYRALAEAGALAVWAAGPDGALRQAGAWCALTGQTPEEARGAGWLDALHPEDQARIRRLWQEAVDAGAVLEAEARIRTRADGWRWALLRAVPLREPGGERVLEWVGTAGDIHARKTAEEALRASQERFRTLAETMPHLVWQTDAAGAPDYMNRRMQDFTGLRPGSGAGGGGGARERRGPGWLATVHPEDAPGLAAAWEAALAEGGEFDLDARLRAADGGGWRWFRVQGAPVRDALGRVRHWVGTCSDIEDRHRVAEERQAALEAQERLARTAEHRIRNSLQLVAALLRLKASRLDEEPAAQEALLAAVARVQAVAEAHRALQKSPDMRSVRVADILAELAAGTSALHPGADLRTAAAEALMLDADRAIPLALVLNELVACALAANGAEAGGGAAIRLAACPGEAEGGGMVVEVAGLPGWPPPPSGRAALAETIVRALLRQIGATLEPRPDGVALRLPPGEPGGQAAR